MAHLYYSKKPAFTVDTPDIQIVVRPKGYKHSIKYGRAKHGFVYVISGKMCDAFVGGEKESIYIDAGEMVFIPKGSMYTGIYLEENTEIVIVQFDLVSGTLPDYLSKPVKIDVASARECMKSFPGFVKNHMSAHPFHYLSCLYRLLWQLDENYSKIPKKYKKLQPALSVLAECWHKNAPISHYAGLCDMSEANFRRLFREYTGKSPVEYRNDLRLDNARARLSSGEFTVSEAAESCGFSNLSYFIRAYKKKFGYTPKQQ